MKFDDFVKDESQVRHIRKQPIVLRAVQVSKRTKVPTLEGSLHAKKGDWIVEGAHGEVYPIDNKILMDTYDFVDGEDDMERQVNQLWTKEVQRSYESCD